jgi:diguanylate cyclase (GGDEF)-like protein
VGSAADLGWVVFYVSWGAAALHPSMARLTEPQRQSRDVATSRIVPLVFAALVAPTVLLVESFEKQLRDGLVIAVFSGIMFLLVLFRLVIQSRRIREQDSVAHTRAMVRELRHHAYRDALTGLGNRLRFQERAERALSRAAESGNAASMLLIDLDNFKEVNDTQGHRAGDELLVAAAGRLAATVRSGDLPVRIGGDEFAVLLADGSPPESAEALAERLIRTFTEPFRLSGGIAEVRASIGVAASTDTAIAPDDDAAEVLFRNADLALYAAKADGKATWRRYDSSLYAAALERMSLRTSLDRALAREEFTLHYQPVVDLRGPLRVTGFEALARWHHPERGLLAPDMFIPLAEETGQIVPLGSWVLGRAIADAARWNAEMPTRSPMRVAVNVSAHQFLGQGLVEAISRRLKESGLAPSLLILEITETAFLHHHGADVSENLSALAALGVGIAIDDFGTGYSSIGYLRDLHIDILKADKTFVDHITESREHATILSGIIHVASSLGIDVVAEGVETEGQLAVLREMGCAYAQGFLFSPAVPFDEVAGLVAVLDADEADEAGVADVADVDQNVADTDSADTDTGGRRP